MGDLGINLLASAIWYVLGLGTTRALQFIKTYGSKQFWRPFLKGKGTLAVVLTDKPGAQPRSPRKISLTDVQAFSDVRSVLASLGRNVEIKSGSSADMDQLQKDSFVSLGGPKANGVSDHVLSRLADRLPVRYDAAEGCFFFGGGQFRAAYSPSGLVTQDYGLIIRLLKLDRNGPDAKPALVVFGLHGHGTEQAIKAITANAHLARTLKPHIKQDLFAFLKFDFVEHKCIKSEIIGANSIP